MSDQDDPPPIIHPSITPRSSLGSGALSFSSSSISPSTSSSGSHGSAKSAVNECLGAWLNYLQVIYIRNIFISMRIYVFFSCTHRFSIIYVHQVIALLKLYQLLSITVLMINNRQCIWVVVQLACKCLHLLHHHNQQHHNLVQLQHNLLQPGMT